MIGMSSLAASARAGDGIASHCAPIAKAQSNVARAAPPYTGLRRFGSAPTDKFIIGFRLASSPRVDRDALRHSLIAQRKLFATGRDAPAAATRLAARLSTILTELEPELLGIYWPMASEFNAPTAVLADTALATLPLALPFAYRSPVRMEYRHWDGSDPVAKDECGIPCGAGAPVVPDVILVPCVGYTAEGYRLGHGGGYFDRWLAQHPSTTAVGVAWSVGLILVGAFQAQAHDQPLTLVVTELGVS